MSRDRIELLQTLQEHTWNKEGWFLPLAAALEGVGPAEAAWQPPGGGNTIWQTVNHLSYYVDRVTLRVIGETPGPALPDNDATFANPGSSEDAAGWQAALERAHKAFDSLTRALSGLSDEDLARPLGDGTVGATLPLLIAHTAYHTGQIVLMRKMQHNWPTSR